MESFHCPLFIFKNYPPRAFVQEEGVNPGFLWLENFDDASVQIESRIKLNVWFIRVTLWLDTTDL